MYKPSTALGDTSLIPDTGFFKANCNKDLAIMSFSPYYTIESWA